MKLTTIRFGEIEIDPDNIITFEQGIPGFVDQKRFVIVRMEEGGPFHFLQEVDEGYLSFIITDPFVFHQHYEFKIPDTVQQQLKITKQEDVAIWSIITLVESIEDATINLLGPIIINTKDKLGKQIILQDSPYLVKQPLIKQQQAEKRGGADASS